MKIKSKQSVFVVDRCSDFMYSNISDRVAETCEACDPKRLLREPLSI